jgi:hypothetical protein
VKRDRYCEVYRDCSLPGLLQICEIIRTKRHLMDFPDPDVLGRGFAKAGIADFKVRQQAWQCLPVVRQGE